MKQTLAATVFAVAVSLESAIAHTPPWATLPALALASVVVVLSLPIPTLMPPLQLDVDLEVRQTRAMGLGLFALRRIPAGTFLFDYQGEELSEEALVARYPPNGAGLAVADYVAELTAGDLLALDPVYLDAADARSSGVARFMNHGAGSRNVVMVAQRWPARALRCFALREVGAGEELRWDYGPGYWRGREAERVPG